MPDYGDNPMPARPSRLRQPEGDYVPPRPPPRRPGSDHSHYPHSLEGRMTADTTSDPQPRSAGERGWADWTTDDRRQFVLAAIRQHPCTTAELRERFAIKRGSAQEQQLYSAVQTLGRQGRITGIDVGSGPQKRWQATTLPSHKAPDTTRDGAQQATEAPGPSATHAAQPAGDDAVARAHGLARGGLKDPEATHRPVPNGPDEDPVTVDRLAISSDGCLLIWHPEHGLIELDPDSTYGIHQIVDRNINLVHHGRTLS